jgi:hypothetical protein
VRDFLKHELLSGGYDFNEKSEIRQALQNLN